MHDPRPNFFAGPYIDRRSEAREAPDWAAAARIDGRTRFLLAHGPQLLVQPGERPRVAFLDAGHPLVQSARDEQMILLGWFRDARCVLLELETEPADLPPDSRFTELRPLTPQLDDEEAGLLAYARALTLWRARARHCGVCGAPTRPERAGHSVVCTSPTCGSEFFPRLDPAIIVLVSDGERALLGRQPGWPPGRYSTVAGFVEPGESLEDAVVREVREETGVEATAVLYDSSQPWPFPASLMIGFHAQATPGSRVEVGGELEDARWFTRDEVPSSSVLLPPPHAISRRLIAAWLEAG